MLRQKAYNSAVLYNIGIAVLFLIQLFVFSPETMDEFEENKQLAIVVPYVTYPSSYLLFLSSGFSLLFFSYALLSRKKNALFYDTFSIFLICRLIFGVFQVILLSAFGEHIGFGNYLIYLFEFFVYMGCLMSITPKSMETFFKVVNICVLVVSIETIYQSVVGILPQVSYIIPWYKSNMIIPFGGSNTLSAIILPVWTAQLFVSQPKTKLRMAFILVMTVALILTKSRFAMLIMFLVFMRAMNKNSSSIIRLLSFIIIAGLFYLFITNLELVTTLFSGFSDDVEGGAANKLSSGRMSYFSTYIDGFLKNPVIGYGPNYEDSRAHNIIIDVLYQNGVVGLFLFISGISYVLKGSKKKALSPQIGYEIEYTRIIVIIYLIQSLAEITYFTYYICDLIFLPCVAFLCLNKRYRYNLIEN